MLGGIAVKFSYKKVVEDAGFVLGVLLYDRRRSFFSAVSLYSRPYRAIHCSCFSLIDKSEIMRDSNWGTNVLIMKMLKMKCLDAIFNEVLIWGYNLSNFGFRKYTHTIIYRTFQRL
ncbi:hypothetical protein ACJIZ3_006151 [Penstemon smallii]|uniref:Uncharacterized protein n=1 Tax=Penstemon smallii TaxID=265156 RepID=A0ABD3S717_9LAMI